MSNIIGSRIKSLRLEKNLTQKELAGALHISNTTLSQYENGQRIPSDEIKLKIVELFDITTDYLMGTSDQRKKTAQKGSLTNEQGNLIVQRALKDTGLLGPEGNLSKKGAQVISNFIANNADLLKKLIEDDK